jgi:hypothetical protein
MVAHHQSFGIWRELPVVATEYEARLLCRSESNRLETKKTDGMLETEALARWEVWISKAVNFYT